MGLTTLEGSDAGRQFFLRRQLGLFNDNSVLIAVCRAVTLLAVEWHPLKATSESQPELTLQKIRYTQRRLAKCGVALLPGK